MPTNFSEALAAYQFALRALLESLQASAAAFAVFKKSWDQVLKTAPDKRRIVECFSGPERQLSNIATIGRKYGLGDLFDAKTQKISNLTEVALLADVTGRANAMKEDGQ